MGQISCGEDRGVIPISSPELPVSDRQIHPERLPMTKVTPHANDNGAPGFAILYASSPKNEILELATIRPRDAGLLAVVWEELARASATNRRDDLMVERFDSRGMVVDDMLVSLQAVERLARRPLAALLRTAIPRCTTNLDTPEV